MRSGQTYVNSDKVVSFKTILAELRRLDDRLPRDGLAQFVVFNKAYFVVTEALMAAARRGYFQNPEFVEGFTVGFAHYYFAALNATVSRDPALPEAWAILNRTASQKGVPNFMLLLMGANAHINHDLPLVLLERIDQAKAEDLLKDILQVDKLLMKSGRKILTTFSEPNRRLAFLKRRFIFLYYRPTMYMILYWRIGTWRSYQRMRKQGVQNRRYAKRSVRIAKRFARLGKFLANL